LMPALRCLLAAGCRKLQVRSGQAHRSVGCPPSFTHVPRSLFQKATRQNTVRPPALRGTGIPEGILKVQGVMRRDLLPTTKEQEPATHKVSPPASTFGQAFRLTLCATELLMPKTQLLL